MWHKCCTNVVRLSAQALHKKCQVLPPHHFLCWSSHAARRPDVFWTEPCYFLTFFAMVTWVNFSSPAIQQTWKGNVLLNALSMPCNIKWLQQQQSTTTLSCLKITAKKKNLNPKKVEKLYTTYQSQTGVHQQSVSCHAPSLQWPPHDCQPLWQYGMSVALGVFPLDSVPSSISLSLFSQKMKVNCNIIINVSPRFEWETVIS